MENALIRGCALVLVVVALPAAAAERARPPEWPRDVLDAFFSDARTKLEGPRPDYDSPPPSGEAASATGASNAPPPFAWSNLIDADTLETEIKRLSQSLDQSVTTPSAFKSGGYKSARRDFSELAALFAVIAQYDAQARWKDIAAAMRDQFARAGFNARLGTDVTYREATDRKADLAALVRGERPPLPKAAAELTDWSQIAARSPLMQRINAAHEERLTRWLADPANFRRQRSDVRHEAQVLALLAEVIHREAFEFWDDETFVDYAIALRQAATDTAAAAASDNFAQARDAANRATAACTDCHAGYRE